jgi:UPF0176 protein
MSKNIQIIAFYEFKNMAGLADLLIIKERLRQLLIETGVRGTIILADEGYNGMVCGEREQICLFAAGAESVLDTKLDIKSSFHDTPPFRRIDVKVKPEIVTLKKRVDLSRGIGTHVKSADWDRLVNDPETLVLDTRNDYECRSGSFRGAVNPGVTKFSDLPDFVEKHLDPRHDKRIAMFCTGGIRCEKFAPYLKGAGFEEVYQLEGGILRYLEEAGGRTELWEGECFVFDERISVDKDLQKGSSPDFSQRRRSSADR